MFDVLTTNGLYALHGQLCDQIGRVHDQMMTIQPHTERYRMLRAHVNELHETASAVYREFTQRHEENANA